MMKIDEASKLLQQDLGDPGSVDICDLNKAQALGIEALIRVEDDRLCGRVNISSWLPGETK